MSVLVLGAQKNMDVFMRAFADMGGCAVIDAQQDINVQLVNNSYNIVLSSLSLPTNL